ncbi:helix-turn-helix domain-containing protein [Streptomyces sp. NPDC090021]|uniref:helix-turn-helix domain-containing protein n=1 Tax=Streptomyces sp. NPDC090021 TaxID=3365919 RepID=UPI0037F4B063
MAERIGQRVAALRRARRMTQADLAREAHVSLPMVKACERGVRSPGPSTLEAIASALGVDASRLDPTHVGTSRHVHAALPAISATIAGYECAVAPADRPLVKEGPARSFGGFPAVLVPFRGGTVGQGWSAATSRSDATEGSALEGPARPGRR